MNAIEYLLTVYGVMIAGTYIMLKGITKLFRRWEPKPPDSRIDFHEVSIVPEAPDPSNGVHPILDVKEK